MYQLNLCYDHILLQTIHDFINFNIHLSISGNVIFNGIPVFQYQLPRDQEDVGQRKLDYSRFSILQASDLNERREELKIKIDEEMIASVDAINMYL